MLTFKEIDERVIHYEEEIEYGAKFIEDVSKLIEDEKQQERQQLLEGEKMKREFYCFVTTSYIDLLCTYRNIKRSKSDWERFYNVKIAYLIIYETINTYHKYKGEIYKTVTKIEQDFYKNFFDMLNREISEFKYEYDYDKVMSKIRNKSSAHYDKDFSSYYESYELLDNPKSRGIIRSFLNFINPLHYFTYGLCKGEIDQFLFINSWLS